MSQTHLRKLAVLLAFAAWVTTAVLAQENKDPQPPQYRGVMEFVDGIFVTPIPDAPMTAVVEVRSTQTLPDGSTVEKKSMAHIARDSRGRIYNERRQLVNASSEVNPELVSFHIFDPETKLNTFLTPATHLARQTTWKGALAAPEANPASPASARKVPPNAEDLGSESMENVLVHGIRKTRVVPAATSGTGKDVVVTDEYWYSDELHLNMLVKHDDPRTGQQTVTVTQLVRTEPDEAMFQVPPGYKVVDEDPVEGTPQK